LDEEEDSANTSYLIEENGDSSAERNDAAYESDVRRRLKSKVCALKYGNEGNSSNNNNNNRNSQNGYLLPRS